VQLFVRCALAGSHQRTRHAQTLRVQVTGDVYVVVSARSSAAITVPDIESQRSVMHIVDAVLIPSSVDVDMR
jgi:uncharacterized surface protein with fasciclin (FAS1) repeats